MRVLNKLPKWLIVAVVMILMLVWTANSTYNYLTAENVGTELGEGLGQLAGSAVGSFRGITEGGSRGYSDGAEAGLKAEDISVEVKNAMLGVGKLEVLIAETRLYDVHSVGEKYKAIYELPGRGVFSVDLNAADIISDEEENYVAVIIPEPQFEFYTDETKVKQIAVNEQFSIQVGAGDGAKAYNSSVSQLKENAKDHLLNYDLLAETARNAAKTQTAKLISSIVGDSVTVYVYFQ